MATHRRSHPEDVSEAGRRKRPARQEGEEVGKASGSELTSPGHLAEDPIALLTNPEAAHPTSSPIRAQAVTALQRFRGNAYVQRLLDSGVVRTKLVVNAPVDEYEREADRVAEQVTSTQGHEVQRQEEEEEEIHAKRSGESTTGLLQRQEEEEFVLPKRSDESTSKVVQRQEEEEEEIYAKRSDESTTGMLQRQEEEEEVPLQMERGTNHPSDSFSELEDRINAARATGQPLTPSARGFFEPRFGLDFSGVRIHTDDTADQLSRELQARAFTTGTDVFFRGGAYDPISHEGRKLLGHELAHVVQQTSPSRISEADATPSQDTRVSRVGEEDESVIRWMAPEAVFIEDFTRTRPPEPVRASQIPAASVPRRFDQFRSHVDPFVAAYNFWTVPAALFWSSMGRVQQLAEHWVVSPNPAALTDDDRQTLSLAAVSPETRAEVTSSAAEASRGPSVTEQLQRLMRSYYELEAAKSALQRARSLLVALRARMAQQDLEDEVNRINQRIQRISQIIQAVGNLALAIGTSGAGAATASRASQAATTYGSGVTQPGAQATAGRALQWLISLAYQDQLQQLRTRISTLKTMIQSSEFDACRAQVESAENRLTAQNIALSEAATALRSALEQRRNVYASLGTRIDTASAERARREGTSGEGFTRYQALFQMAAAVREAATTGSAALQFTGADGIINMVVATRAGRDYGPPGFGPNEPDIGQFVISDALSRCIGFALWARDNLPRLESWAQGWTGFFSQIGRTGPQAPPVVQHETY